MKIYDRKKTEYEEITQYGQEKLRFLYGNPLGRVLLKIAVSPAVSDLYRFLNGRKSSVKKIPGFIEENHIRMEDFEDREYRSFNDFFTRRLRDGARKIETDRNILISPADAKLLVYNIDDDLRMKDKGRTYTLEEILTDDKYCEEYSGGYCLVYRLCVDDLHRYCFIDDGRLKGRKTIKGKLHTVSSLSADHKIYKENFRVVNVMDTENFGRVIHIEVGALIVGRVVNHDVRSFTKGEEKGYFEPGGSTIIEIFEKDSVRIDEDILTQSKDHIETKVKFGEGVGTAC
jgi:phosphatidylserine decarboxylase